MSVTVWDAELGASRPATQEDIDILQAKANAFGKLTDHMTEVVALLMGTMRGIRERNRTAEQLSGDL